MTEVPEHLKRRAQRAMERDAQRDQIVFDDTTLSPDELKEAEDRAKRRLLDQYLEPGELDFTATEEYGQVPAKFANDIAEIVQRNFPKQHVLLSQRYGIAQAVWNYFCRSNNEPSA